MCLNLRSAVFDSRHWSLGRSRGDARRVLVAAHGVPGSDNLDNGREQPRSGQRAVDMPNTRVSCMDEKRRAIGHARMQTLTITADDVQEGVWLLTSDSHTRTQLSGRRLGRLFAGRLSPLCALNACCAPLATYLAGRVTACDSSAAGDRRPQWSSSATLTPHTASGTPGSRAIAD